LRPFPRVKTAPQTRLKRRSGIILLLADGLSQAAVAAKLGVSRRTARALARHVGVSHSTALRVWRDGQG